MEKQRLFRLYLWKNPIILDTMKPAEDGSDDVILRFYEAKKAAVDTDIICNLGGKKAYLCDMLENVQEEISMENGKMNLSFRPFEIKTVRIKF